MSGLHFPLLARARQGRSAAAVVGVTIVLALSGCQSSTGSPGSDAKAESLPGTKEFGLTEVQFVQHIEDTQALIAECMAEAGFEYIPVDVKTIEAAQARAVYHHLGAVKEEAETQSAFV